MRYEQHALGHSSIMSLLYIITLLLLLSQYNCSSIEERLHDLLERTHSHRDTHCHRWIVVTSINDVTPSIRAAAALPGWRVVVVSDRKGLPASSYNNSTNIVYLDVEAQQQLDYEIIELLPYNSYARKNIGYLYAIAHGAEVIYETDDDNQLLADLSNFLPATARGLLVHDSAGCCFNPYAHFGQPSIWPRGYPLNEIRQPDSREFTRAAGVNAWIQQSLANGDPDVDAIFRLTRSTPGQSIDIAFDESAEAVALAPRTFCPYNSQNTLHHQPAFWALLLPISVSFRVSDIWRSYWAQRLLWQIDGRLVFLPPFVYQARNAHNYASDFEDELQLYTDSERLIDFLQHWQPRAPAFVDQVVELSEAMANAGFWLHDDVQLVSAWCRDLQSLGYSFPSTAATASTAAAGSQVQLQPVQALPSVMMKHLQITTAAPANKPALLIFICILAAPHERVLRDTVRSTYLTLAPNTVSYRFFTDYRNEEQLQELLQEQEQYGDLHISSSGVHCPPGRHCTTSFGIVLEALQWAVESYHFSYFLRLDLDGYLCIPQLVQSMSSRPRRAFVAGNFGCHSNAPKNFFRADGAFILLSADLATLFLDLQPLLHANNETTFALNFGALTFHLNVIYENWRWTGAINTVCDSQVFVHAIKNQKHIVEAHALALERLNTSVPLVPVGRVCEERADRIVCQHSEFWGDHCIDVSRHWSRTGT